VPYPLIGKLSDWAEVAIGVPRHKVSENSLVAPFANKFSQDKEGEKT
jgi:hypothetical protein